MRTSTFPSGTVSVVIPTFDRAEALERAVRSCLAQTHAVHEVLVCDDGSTDGSRERMHALGDERVKWLEGPRAGRPAVPRNRGIAAATGEWVAFLDDDDAWHPDKLSVQLQRLQGSDHGMACTNALRVRPGISEHVPYLPELRDPFDAAALLRVNQVICSSALVRTDLLRTLSTFPEAPELRGLEDYALWLCLALHTSILYCPEPLTIYHDQPANSMRAGSLSVPEQRDRVLTWLRGTRSYATATPALRRAVDGHLRAARRAAGRDLFTWLFLR